VNGLATVTSSSFHRLASRARSAVCTRGSRPKRTGCIFNYSRLELIEAATGRYDRGAPGDYECGPSDLAWGVHAERCRMFRIIMWIPMMLGFMSAERLAEKSPPGVRLVQSCSVHRPPARPPRRLPVLASVSRNRPSCDGWHIRLHTGALPCVSVNGGCDMVADWILIWLLFLTPTAIADAGPKGAADDRLRRHWLG
jgi:hypothetical protein